MIFLTNFSQIRQDDVRILSATNSDVITRPGGEIGRHKRLKISRLYGRAGSIPAPGTRKYIFTVQ